MYDREKFFWKEIYVRYFFVYINILVIYIRGLFSGVDIYIREVFVGEFLMFVFLCY